MLTSILLSATLSPAHACGGFFCNNDPVDQAGEDIVFAVDSAKDQVTAHVQIAYTGNADEFAWIVPVANVPELFLSTDRMFQELSWRTAPRFNVEYKEILNCEGGSWGYPEAALSSYASASVLDSGSGGGVNVVSQETVGPYDTVILQARTSDALLDWLQAEGYLLPNALDEVLNPYIAEESYFVALKLAKDREVGDLAPLAMRYEGGQASVPIQLTSVAATEDMRLNVYVLGDARAVPESYYHVQVNDLVIDWFRGGSNWEDAITIAADEAGGHAFATDYSGDTSPMADALYTDGRYDIAALASAGNPYSFFDEVLSQGFAGDAQMFLMWQEFLPMPAALEGQVSLQDFYNCLECYSEHVDTVPFDSEAFAEAIDERIVTPLRDAQALFTEFTHLTRMTSSVSPVEMTVDPTFVFNRDMEQTVAQDRYATVEMLCGWGGTWTDSPRRLVLEDGRAYNLPPIQWFWDNNMTEYEFLSDLMDHFALIIEDTSDQGEPVVIFDGSEDALAAAEVFNGEEPGVGGCGCNSTAPAGALAMLGLVGLAARRRRS